MPEKSVKVLLTGGGTGGHVFPGIVIAEEIRRREPNAKILFVGTRRGLESKVVPRLGYEIEYVDVRYFERSFSPRNIVTAYKAFASVLGARRIISRFKPDVVVGTGGYVSGPVVLAASLAQIPTLIHEQNAFPGLTTRLLARRVDIVAVSHSEAVARVGAAAKAVVTGHPVRREFFETSRAEARRSLNLKAKDRLVLVVGGSGGAEKINQVTLEAAPAIVGRPGIILMHVTGSRYYDWVSREREKLPLRPEQAQRYQLADFIHNIPVAMAACDLIVARSGGMVHEITAAGRPSLLIPSPNVTDDHQLHNARAMAAQGAAIVLEEKDLNAQKFAREILAVLEDARRLDDMAAAAKNMGRPEAGSKLAELILKMAKK